MPIVVTPATLADLPALCELLTALFTQEAEFKPDAQAQRRGLSRILNDPVLGMVVVVRRQGEVLGMATLLFTVSTALGERVAWLEDVVVKPGHRRSGLGKLLMQGVIEQARWQGCHRLTLLTDAHNEEGRHFYEQHGFTASSMVPYRLSLTEAPAR
jgi:GNAT superfamily N-acetyltransferase